MKRLIRFLPVLFVLFVISQSVEAQLPQVGVEYYIENGSMPKQSDGIARSGLLLTGADSVDVNITLEAWNIVQNKDRQIWTLDAAGYLTNKATGRKISFGPENHFSTHTVGVQFTFEALTAPAGFVALSRDHGNNYFEANDGPVERWTISEKPRAASLNNAALEGSPQAWLFIPVADFESRHYPVISSINDKWHVIANCTRTGEILTEGSSGLELKPGMVDNATDNQLWKIVAAPDDSLNKLCSVLNPEGPSIPVTATDLLNHILSNEDNLSLFNRWYAVNISRMSEEEQYQTISYMMHVGTPQEICAGKAKVIFDRQVLLYKTISGNSIYQTQFIDRFGINTAYSEARSRLSSLLFGMNSELRDANHANSKVYIINKSSGKYIDLSGSPLMPTLRSGQPVAPLTIKGVRGGELSITLRDATGNGIPSLMANPTGTVIMVGEPCYKTTGSTWHFIPKAQQTSVGKSLSDTVAVYVENGYVKVKGTDEAFSLFTITGTSLPAHKQLCPGIYIVKFSDRTVKVSVR